MSQTLSTPLSQVDSSEPNCAARKTIGLVFTREELREVDRRAITEYGLPGLVLMENAGRNAAGLLRDLGVRGPVAICCGKGNNAGDGFVMARHLENAGLDVRVLLTTPTSAVRGDAAVELQVLRRAGTPVAEAASDLASDLATAWRDELARADWIVDALLGTGTQGAVREPFVSAIAVINAARRKVLAVDLPSGLNCDTGEGHRDCVRATHTATFVARKLCFDLSEVAEITGPVHVLDIGVPRTMLLNIHQIRTTVAQTNH